MGANSRSVLALASYALLCLGSPGCGSSRSAPQPPHNLLLIVVDTLAARYVSLHNEEVTFTPCLEGLRNRRTTVFAHSYSVAPWTKPTIASMFTGLYPSEHGVMDLRHTFKPAVQTLAERLGAHGFETKGIVSHTLLGPRSGFERGFDEYANVNATNPHGTITSSDVTDEALQWLEPRAGAREEARPFFLFLHYFDPHYQYNHHELYDRSSWYEGGITPEKDFEVLLDEAWAGQLGEDDFRYLRSLYQEEVAFTDEHIGRLLDGMGALGLLDDTLVVFTADHGEEFGDHGSIGHTKTLYDELIEVPLVVSFPGEPTLEIADEVVSTIDLMPTLLDLYGLPAPERITGRSLVPLLADPRALLERQGVYAEVSYSARKRRAKKVARIEERRKLVYDQEQERYELYDLEADPLEQESLFDAGSADQQRMMRALELFQRSIQGGRAPGSGAGDRLEFSAQELEQLRQLGYL